MRDWIYDLTLKPLFFKMSPEDAHSLSVGLLNLANVMPGMYEIIHKFTTYKSTRLKTEVAGIQFDHPLGMAAGFDKSGDLYPFLKRLGFSHVEIGTVTGQEQEGNPKPRIFRYEKEEALVNRMGFNNPGAEKVAQKISKQKKSIVRGINAGKTKVVLPENAVEDYVKTFRLLSPYGDYGVINISSPNTPGLRGFQEKDSFLELIGGIKKEFNGSFPLPMFVKLAPDLEESALLELLDLVLDIGLSGVILTNTTINKTVLPYFDNVETGGISGRVLREKSTRMVQVAYQKLGSRLPIIGVGGIMDGPSALEKILAGAELIQIYTGYIYRGPFLPYTILEYIDNFLKKEGVSSVREIVGKGVEFRS
ncbi:MAG: quinone-dependent dihydroorotate dehydrogenase [Leptospiraceae bacterium]|nr:quinone-dependent dihydroorotate dehydrogenase [Leptospiraceae bacterium]MCP5513114.1 quinone-dependent dihydroorotate dehydrogenase [Leptospiraceae bacterium]